MGGSGKAKRSPCNYHNDRCPFLTDRDRNRCFRDLVSPTLRFVLLLSCSNVFMTLALCHMKQPLKLEYLWAACCIMGAVYFVFRSP
jgi:hypothetical protein